MDYNLLYETTYQKYFSLAEKLLKKKYVTYKNEGYTFNFTYNELIREYWVYIRLLEKDLRENYNLTYLKLFNDRFQLFETDRILNVINKRIVPLLKKNKEQHIFDFHNFIYKTAKLDALKETSRLMSNNNRLIERMFELNDFRNFEIKQYPSSLENLPLYQKLNEKVYPSPKISKSKITIKDVNEDEYLNVKEVSELTNYAVATIYDKKFKGEIPFYKNGAKLQFKKSEILDWLEKGKGTTKDDLEEKANEYLLKNS